MIPCAFEIKHMFSEAKLDVLFRGIPEHPLRKKKMWFWDRVYRLIRDQYGMTWHIAIEVSTTQDHSSLEIEDVVFISFPE